MGLFDSVVASVLGNVGGGGPIGSILSSILTNQGGSGGLPGLISQFEQAGLGHVIGSWISTETNQAVTPDALQQVFGGQQVQQWAQQAGMSQSDLLQSLSKLLPHAVDQATPNGEIPSSPFDDRGTTAPGG